LILKYADYKFGYSATEKAKTQLNLYFVEFHSNLFFWRRVCVKIVSRFTHHFVFLGMLPAVIVGCADVTSLLTGKWAIVDAAIAMQNMVVAAWTLAVGSCWLGDFNEEKVKELLKIPDNWKVVALVTFGYPAEQPKQKKKKPLE